MSFLKSYQVLSAVFLVLTLLYCCEEKPFQPLLRAHAHNDYDHEQPLFDALSSGFISIEVDIHILNNELYVAHDSIDIRKDRTLQKLYLDPLYRRVHKNGGSAYNHPSQLILLIDIKTDSLLTYIKLHEVLKQYRPMLTVFYMNEKYDGAVSVIISGNRPISFIQSQIERYAAIDGRINMSDKHNDPMLFPLVSDNWTDHFTWDGKGTMPVGENKKLSDIIMKLHKNNQMLRFWATPDSAGPNRDAVWTKLYNSGVDLIGTDDLAGLRDFLRMKTEH